MFFVIRLLSLGQTLPSNSLVGGFGLNSDTRKKKNNLNLEFVRKNKSDIDPFELELLLLVLWFLLFFSKNNAAR